MDNLQEYDLEFIPVHIINGHGPCQLVEEAMNDTKGDPSKWEQEIDMYNVEQSTPTTISNSWYTNVHQ